MLNHRVCTRTTLWSPTPLPTPALHAGNIPFTASARGRQTTALLPRPGPAQQAQLPRGCRGTSAPSLRCAHGSWEQAHTGAGLGCGGRGRAAGPHARHAGAQSSPARGSISLSLKVRLKVRCGQPAAPLGPGETPHPAQLHVWACTAPSAAHAPPLGHAPVLGPAPLVVPAPPLGHAPPAGPSFTPVTPPPPRPQRGGCGRYGDGEHRHGEGRQTGAFSPKTAGRGVGGGGEERDATPVDAAEARAVLWVGTCPQVLQRLPQIPGRRGVACHALPRGRFCSFAFPDLEL